MRMSLVVSMAAWGDRFADTRSWLFRMIEEIVVRSTLNWRRRMPIETLVDKDSWQSG